LLQNTYSPLLVTKHIFAACCYKTHIRSKRCFHENRFLSKNTYSTLVVTNRAFARNAAFEKTAFYPKTRNRWKTQFAGNRFVVTKHEFTENPKNRFNKQNRLLFFFNKTRIFANRDKSFFVRKKEKKESKILLQGH
jgi:hypothetical protein